LVITSFLLPHYEVKVSLNDYLSGAEPSHPRPLSFALKFLWDPAPPPPPWRRPTCCLALNLSWEAIYSLFSPAVLFFLLPRLLIFDKRCSPFLTYASTLLVAHEVTPFHLKSGRAYITASSLSTFFFSSQAGGSLQSTKPSSSTRVLFQSADGSPPKIIGSQVFCIFPPCLPLLGSFFRGQWVYVRLLPS